VQVARKPALFNAEFASGLAQVKKKHGTGPPAPCINASDGEVY
jgi:hypothetical protein